MVSLQIDSGFSGCRYLGFALRIVFSLIVGAVDLDGISDLGCHELRCG